MNSAVSTCCRRCTAEASTWAVEVSSEVVSLSSSSRSSLLVFSPRKRRKIYALCEALGWNDDPRRIQGFVKRVAHVDRIEWLNIAQCEKVIEGLKAILAREQRKGAGRDG